MNGDSRIDIEYQLRPGKGHEGNEKDVTSLKFSIAWFEHFYQDSSIDISNLETEIIAITLLGFNYPNNIASETLIIISSIFLFAGLSLLIVKFKILPFWNNLPIKPVVDDSREGKEKYKKMFIYRTLSYLGAVLITSLLFTFFNKLLERIRKSM